ncbi:hypothetical protein OIDMADRAFT_36770 [Oidiodendron maius Zn]|uniref:NAD-dependent epimerase/dehydratase domain-containing protein n=1 Tax=Oidiodendron maius (strain Zn) TaxID=913774 RepID=A0A0C3DYN0_OIDMZ|nr:hypothetical protein OIDMADRAFT_36770 [Oidiodendron maius Zn]
MTRAHVDERDIRFLLTGAAGFIRQIVSKELLGDDSNQLVLTDTVEPPIPPSSRYPQYAVTVQADLVEGSSSVVSKDLDAILLFHGMMSSAAEANFELGYRANVDATRALLDNIGQICPGIRVIYASSEDVYGTPVPKRNVTEADITTTELSYGCQKVICETLINDYTRRGMINGFSLRFPTISVRPGLPSAAVTSFLSGIVREPLNREVCNIPLEDRAWRHWIRAVNVPGFGVTVQEMLDALKELELREKEVPGMKSLLYSWADHFDNILGLSLGIKQDSSFVQSALDYKKFLEG